LRDGGASTHPHGTTTTQTAKHLRGPDDEAASTSADDSGEVADDKHAATMNTRELDRDELDHEELDSMAVPDSTAAAECISDEALVHLKSYKYSAVDKSPVTHYVLMPWCNTFVKVLPMWLAPNMVTLLGFCFVLANVVLLEVVMPDLVGPAPSWVYFSFAFGLFGSPVFTRWRHLVVVALPPRPAPSVPPGVAIPLPPPPIGDVRPSRINLDVVVVPGVGAAQPRPAPAAISLAYTYTHTPT
jgi:hypothetical protein